MSHRYGASFGRSKTQKRVLPALLCAVLVLVLAAAVCVVGLWVFHVYRSYLPPESSTSGVTDIRDLQFTENDTRHVLCITTDGSAVTGAVLVRFAPIDRRVTVLLLPVDTALSYGQSRKTLGVLYAESGVRPLQEAVGNALGLTVRSTAVLTAEGLSNWVERLGNGLPVTVSSPLTAGPLQLQAGSHNLTAAQVLQLMRDKPDSERLAWLLAALGNRYLRTDRTFMTDFDRLTAVWNTASTVRRTDVIAYRTVLEALAAQNEGALCRAAALPGERVGEGTSARFELPDDAAGALASIF